jgi:hypothetical protein
MDARLRRTTGLRHRRLPRMLVHNERVVHEYLMWAMCGKLRPKGKAEAEVSLQRVLFPVYAESGHLVLEGSRNFAPHTTICCANAGSATGVSTAITKGKIIVCEFESRASGQRQMLPA